MFSDDKFKNPLLIPGIGFFNKSHYERVYIFFLPFVD